MFGRIQELPMQYSIVFSITFVAYEAARDTSGYAIHLMNDFKSLLLKFRFFTLNAVKTICIPILILNKSKVMRFIFLFTLLTFITTTQAQNSYEATLKDKSNQEPLIGVTALIPSLKKGAISDENGRVSITGIPNGTFTVQFSYLGYKSQDILLNFPLDAEQPTQLIYLIPFAEQMEEVTLISTRNSRTIEDIPTRIEFIAGEELSEKGNMKPGDIRMLLNESTGIRTQQTSATSYNSSIRIQGLDGKYTQLLRDGFPLYSGFSGGLSLMQIAPLDLKQVEVIKGSSSTLYGGGAIAGLVNLISKTPEDEPELSFMFNGTSAFGLDVSGFYSGRNPKIGATVFASYNIGTPYDPADLGLTAIPEFDRFTLNPKFYWYIRDRTELMVGVNTVLEKRLGGNIEYVKGDTSSNAYFEENDTERISTQVAFTHNLSATSKLELKNSFSFYNRNINVPQFEFSGNQISSFSELNILLMGDTTEWVAGLNLWTEDFDQLNEIPSGSLDQRNNTFGLFVQNSWTISDAWAVESGFRADYHSDYGFFSLPRMALLYKPREALTFRLGGGLGYKTPTIFTEDAERLQFENLLPIAEANTEAERSIGGNFDVNYKFALSPELSVSMNSLLFYTQIVDPLTLNLNNNGFYEFQQPDGYVDTKGMEINLKFNYLDFKLFSGYTHANVKQHQNGIKSDFPLVAKHRLNNVLMYEKEDNLWIGLEAYFYSPQKLGDGASGQSFWILGLMSEKKLGKNLSIFLNFENFLDTRQTRFDTIFTGSIDDPQFRDIYAPLDGFVINGGFKLGI